MTRFSILVLLLLLISLPFKFTYFEGTVSSETEILLRQETANQIAEVLADQGFTVTSEPDDIFLPTLEMVNDSCILAITPLPVTKDLDATFTFIFGDFGGTLAYYFDGEFFTAPPVIFPTFWEHSSRALRKVGINTRPRIRLGIAYSDSCNLQNLRLEQ